MARRQTSRDTPILDDTRDLWLLSHVIRDPVARMIYAKEAPKETSQTFPGTTHIYAGGTRVGGIACVNQTSKIKKWLEIWVIDDWAAFTAAGVELSWSYVDSLTTEEQMMRESVAIRAAAAQGKTAKLEFNYCEPPTSAEQISSLPAMLPGARLTFRAYGRSEGVETESGTLFREVSSDGTHWVDHWMLYENWTASTTPVFKSVEPSYNSRDAFLQAMNTRRGTTAGWRYVGVQSTWTAL